MFALLPYWLLFLGWMVAALAYNRAQQPVAGAVVGGRGTPRATIGIVFLVLATALLMGLRYQVGCDWETYAGMYNDAQLLPASRVLGSTDIGYAALMLVAGRLEAGMWLVNSCCALIMALGVMRFCLRQPNPALSFLVAIPYLIIVVGMGYTRQGVAIGILLAGLANASERSVVKLVLFVFAAALFHRTALLMLPLALAPIIRKNLLYALFGGLAFAILFIVLLRDQADTMITSYVDTDYKSGGAVIRVAMNLPPAVLALTLRRRLGFTPYQSDLWSVFALVALATLPLVLAASFSTAIDRLALFLIPLQIVILPRLPYIFGDRKALNAQLTLAVIGYSAAVQMVWLVFATHADCWVPYHSYIFGV